jgi:hypothetical protein
MTTIAGAFAGLVSTPAHLIQIIFKFCSKAQLVRLGKIRELRFNAGVGGRELADTINMQEG